MASIPAEIDLEHRRCVVGGEPLIFHCHHYNTFLQRSINDARLPGSDEFLIGAAAEVAHAQLRQLFKRLELSGVPVRKRMAEELYAWAGFGTLDLSTLTEKGGVTETRNSHYSKTWRLKFERSEEPVCFFASGWLAGALAAIYELPNGAFAVSHSRCMATSRDEVCAFELSPGSPNYQLYQSVGVGPLSPRHTPRPVPQSSVDYEGILRAVGSMEMAGDAQGEISLFGVYLTHHYANYYNRISFELLNTLEKRFGQEGVAVARPLLIEAGHVCAFHTFGGIMTSTEWDALIRPTLKTREDWVHGMVAVANALGWGRWQVTQVSEKTAEFVLHDDYESIGHLAMYGPSKRPISYLAEGGVAGLMNLVYRGDIAEKPELTPAYYDELFRKNDVYRAEALTSRAMGDEVTSFRVRL